MLTEHPQWEERLIHYQYIHDLLSHRHVLEVGCGNGSGADFLADVADQVVVVDTSTERVRQCRAARSRSNVEWVVGDPDHIQAADGAFDVVVMPELDRWFTRGGLLPEVRRVLAPDGTVLFAVRNGDRDDASTGMAFADLEEYLTQSFENVRILGAIPFYGSTIADFDPEGELEPELDCSLVQEDESPASYLALCSRVTIPSPGYSVLQVPPSALAPSPLRTLQAPPALTAVDTLADAKAQDPQVMVVTRLLDRESARAGDLERRFEQARTHVDEMSRRYLEERGRVEVERVRADAAERSYNDCQRAVDQQRERAESAERRCDSLVIRVEQGAGELSTLHQRMAELQGLRQADQWHIDELVGRLRKYERPDADGKAPTPSAPSALSAQSTFDPRELERARDRIVKLERDLDQLRDKGGSGDVAAASELKKRLEQAEARAVAAEQRSASREESARQAEKRATKSEHRFKDVVAQAEEVQREKVELEKELMRSESRVQENSRRATNSESKVVQLEVRLKRAESEAATLSKWAEELRDELKASQGKSKVIPPTPEPEVAALRNDLRQARERVGALEERCDTLMAEVEQARTNATQKEKELSEALRGVDGNLVQEVLKLRKQNAEVTSLKAQLEQTGRELARSERQLRDSEQAETELKRTRRELGELRRQVTDVDAASDELEQLRMESVHHKETTEELGRVREELESTRIELTRCEEELRSGTASGLPEEAAWGDWEEEEEEEEPETQGYVGEEMPDDESDEDDDEGWDTAERMRVQDRQIEALLEGAALHREEMERQRAQVAEMDALIEELQLEHRAVEKRLVECGELRSVDQRAIQQLKDENINLGRDLARVQGELKRCEDERSQLERDSADLPTTGPMDGSVDHHRLQDDLSREIRMRQQLQEDLEHRLAELDQLRRDLRAKDQALDHLRSEDTERRAELRELRQQSRDLERDAQRCHDELRERDRRIEELGQPPQGSPPAASGGEELQALSVELNRASVRNRELELGLAQEKQESDRLQTQVGRLKPQLQGAEEQIQYLNEELSRAKAALANAEREVAHVRSEGDQREQEMEQLRIQQEKCEEQVKELESQISEQKERVAELKQQLAELPTPSPHT